MKKKSRILIVAAAVLVGVVLALVLGALPGGDGKDSFFVDLLSDEFEEEVDMTAWSYDEEQGVYYQENVPYVTNQEEYANCLLSIYVPQGFFEGTEQEDGLYSCILKQDGSSGIYSVEGAAYILDLNSEDTSAYLSDGLIVVDVKTDSDAVLSVAELKAAIRFLRYHGETLPGAAEKIYVSGFGTSATLAVALGATGDLITYEDYLKDMGAVLSDAEGESISDAVLGVMAYCPQVGPDALDSSYAWLVGQYHSDIYQDSSLAGALYEYLAADYVSYIQNANLMDEYGNVLTLGDDGVSGTYYDTVLEQLQISLNQFLSYVAFPYTDGDGNTYESPEAYITALNASEEWVTYDSEQAYATIKSLEGYANNYLSPADTISAYDALDGSSSLNEFFAVAGDSGKHFSSRLNNVLTENEDALSSLVATEESGSDNFFDAFQLSMEAEDTLGSSQEKRMNMLNPLFYLLSSQEGYGNSTAASYWRINTGAASQEASLPQIINLYTALSRTKSVTSLELTLLWDKGYEEAELMDSAEVNVREWIRTCEATNAQ